MDKKNNWLTQELRISIFLSQEKTQEIKDLWPKIEGVELERATDDSKIGVNTKEGWFNKHKIVLVTTPMKVDFIMTVQAPLRIENNKPVLEAIGTFEESVKEFILIIKSWLGTDNFPEIVRIAFGGHLVLPVNSRGEGYKLLSDYVFYNIDPDKMTDFSLQVNLLKNSSVVKGLSLNRLTKWNVLKITPELAMIGGTKITHEFVSLELAHVELDINSNPLNKGLLDKANVFDLFLELVSEGKELSEKGVMEHAN